MRMRRGWRGDVFAFVALFSLWDGDGMRDLLSWWGFSALSLLLLAGGVVVLVRRRRHLRLLLRRSSTLPLLLFLAVCLLSTVWSAYPGATLLGCFAQIATTVVGVSLVLLRSVARLTAVFTLVLHVNLAASLVFEAVVATLVPGHVLEPFFTSYSAGAPGAFAWSQGLLFTGQRIQGIVGNANLTCFLALLAMICLGCLVAAKRVRPRLAVPALALDLLMFALTRSATVLIASGVVVAALVLVLGFRHVRGGGRVLLAGGALATGALAALSTSALADPVLRLLGKGDDFTGRLEIWHAVGQLVAERPVLGWGFVGWWVPWVQPFEGRVVRGGVTYLQAHNAYFDVELQLGVAGLAALALLTGSVAYRALHLAAVRAPLAVLPLLLLAALLTQALAESRLLIEGNWALLAMLSVALPWERHHRLSPEDGTSRVLVATG